MSAAEVPLEFHGCSWRVDVPLASRTCANPKPKPTVQLQLLLAESSAEGSEQSAPVRERWIEMDYDTLVQLTQSVDAAAKALEDAPYRRVQRRVK